MMCKMLAINNGCTLALSVGFGFGISYVLLKFSERFIKQCEDKEYKLALVARKNIKTLNKMAVLCTHAAEMANEHMKIQDPQFYEECQIFRQPKVVLKADCSSMMKAEKKAQDLGLQVTGITGSDGTSIVIAIGPGPVDLVNKATSELKLF